MIFENQFELSVFANKLFIFTRAPALVGGGCGWLGSVTLGNHSRGGVFPLCTDPVPHSPR